MVQQNRYQKGMHQTKKQRFLSIPNRFTNFLFLLVQGGVVDFFLSLGASQFNSKRSSPRCWIDLVSIIFVGRTGAKKPRWEEPVKYWYAEFGAFHKKKRGKSW